MPDQKTVRVGRFIWNHSFGEITALHSGAGRVGKQLHLQLHKCEAIVVHVLVDRTRM